MTSDTRPSGIPTMSASCERDNDWCFLQHTESMQSDRSYNTYSHSSHMMAPSDSGNHGSTLHASRDGTLEGIPDLSYKKQLARPKGTSPICRFFAGTSILLTGATGFMGKVLLQKVMRCAPDIHVIYVLIRSKKGKDPSQRLDELFDDKLFECMKEAVPEWRSKVHLVVGDVSEKGLGLSDVDREMLCATVDIVIHGAATVRFDEALKKAITINVRGTKEMFDLAHQIQHLKAFTHISTAYSHCVRPCINEEFYEPTIPYNRAIEIAESLDDDLLESISPKILGKYPNTYVFTKSLAEDVANKEGNGLPLVVFRPAIVVSTSKDPVPGWIDNVYGPTGVVLGAGVGLLRVLHCDPDSVSNIVPVDMAVNALIAATWDIACNHNNNNCIEDATFGKLLPNGVTKGIGNGIANGYKNGITTTMSNGPITNTLQCDTKSKSRSASSTVPIYNYVSCNEAPISWASFKYMIEKHTLHYPTVRMVWYYSFRLTKYRLPYLVMALLLHWIPALIMDSALMLSRGKPQMVKAYKKIHKFSGVITYFSTKTWEFNNQNVIDLWSRLDEQDKDIFHFDMKHFNWEEFFLTYGLGARVFFLKDDVTTLPGARRKWNRLYWIHQCLKVALVALIIWLLFWP